MKNRLHVAFTILFLAALACANPLNRDTIYVERIKVIKVEVAPPSGTDSFTLNVGYQTCIDCSQAEANEILVFQIHCSYVAPDTATMEIGTFYDDHDYGEDEGTWFSMSRELTFNVRRPDGSILPGTYLAGCSTGYSSPVTTTFTVVTEPTPTAPSAPNPVPTTTPSTPASALTWGRITYDWASDRQTPHLQSGGILPSEFQKWCNPSITIDTNGAISGTCSSSQNPADLGLYGTWFGPGSSIEGKVTGTLVPGGSFTFHEELTERYESPDNPTIWWAIRTIILDGTGTFVSATQARGTASYSAECTGSNEDANYCGDGYTLSTHDSFTGTINWEFNGGVTMRNFLSFLFTPW